jgi:hypothetical protein
VNSTYLLREILRKISRKKALIIITGFILAVLLFFIARSIKTEYTSKATVFPLTNPSDNALSTSSLSSLLGVSDAPKSFSSDASINIIELALSRNVRESVAAERLPEYGNKMIAELVIQEENSKKPFFSKKIKLPDDSAACVILGGELLMPAINAKMNKNGVLELYFTSSDFGLVKPVSDILVSKISQFYINLRIEKATEDYNFIVKKIDSVQNVLDHLDAKAIQLSNTTVFTPVDRLEYSIPKDNLSDEKLRVAHERDININNREEALWRLQKVTPIIATLDKPNPPFDTEKPSSIIYAIIGFIVGCFIATIIAISGLLYKYVKAEIYKTVFGDAAQSTTA